MAAGTGATAAPAGASQHVHDIITSFRPSKRFRCEPGSNITSLDFDESGDILAITRDNETIEIFNCIKGKKANDLKAQKYGAHLIRFTHQGNAVVHASTKIDPNRKPEDNHAIRYLQTHDNSFIRYFKGHTDTVTSIAVSPKDDDFISCGKDGFVRLWNFGKTVQQGWLELPGASLVAYDPSGNVFAIANPRAQTILMYDAKNYDKPPFAEFDVSRFEKTYTPKTAARGWTKIEFSNDGKSLLLATNGIGHYVLDGFEGTLTHFLIRKRGSSGRAAAGEDKPGAASSQGDVCFSPDGRYVIGGSGDQGIQIWDVYTTPSRDKTLENMEMITEVGGKTAIAAYNHRYNLLCTADKDLVLWLPDADAVD